MVERLKLEARTHVANWFYRGEKVNLCQYLGLTPLYIIKTCTTSDQNMSENDDAVLKRAQSFEVVCIRSRFLGSTFVLWEHFLMLLGTFIISIAILTVDGQRVYAADASDQILAIPDYKSTEGIILFTNRQIATPQTSSIATQVLWSYGNLVCELIENSHGTNLVVDAQGTYKGTNWEYRNPILILDGQPGEGLSRLYASLDGLTPQEFLLASVLGRGFTPREVATLKRIDRSTLTGEAAGKIPVSIHIEQSDQGANTLTYEVKLTKALIKYTRSFSLVPFSSSNYIPNVLQCVVTHNGTTFIPLDIAVVYATNRVSGISLSPWKRYVIKEEQLLENNQLYTLQLNNQKRLIPAANQIESHERKNTIIRAVVIAFFVVGSAIPLWMLYRGRKQNK